MSIPIKIKRILLIDDDKSIRDLLSLWLMLQGYDIVQASNGMDAISTLQQETVDLIMVDLMMPVMDGLGFLRWLRTEAHNDVPVLVLTAMVKADTEAMVLEAGAMALLYKPVNEVELQRRLQTLETAS